MSQKCTSEPIAIIGGACRFAGDASSPSKLWELLERPRDVLKEIPESRFNVDGFYHPDGSYHGHNNVRHSYLIDEDVRAFDPQFFGIKPVEARAMDPQQRLLLEVVYEGLESAGLTLQDLRGTDTAAYVGLMCNDYEFVAFRDLNTLPTYHATGAGRSIMSNRISYFFDWHGPSVTLDTACSSSLYAVYYAAQALRSGSSRTAVACGSNLILGPENFITESMLKMLSPESRSRMWDASANGYARGDGVAMVVLKTLSAAIEDGDHIECIIREIGVNQDGATNGITMPSATAQADLIRQTYDRAGLDPLGDGRPQYFEAHGTGTPAGDPIEAEAISRSFTPGVSSKSNLYVGSIKTVLGHTEGTAGVASLMKASLALQNEVIPPNLLFNKLSSSIEPFYNGLEVPTEPQRWPALQKGQPRRASVNSFGFGGANAHAILESYDQKTEGGGEGVLLGPYVFSAGSEQSLVRNLEAYLALLDEQGISATSRDLAWTLRKRRSALPLRMSFPAGSIEQLRANIKSKLLESQEQKTALGTRSSLTSRPRILGIFTGQGAQYACMGAELFEKSQLAGRIINELESHLACLPESDRPAWSLTSELRAGADISRLDQAELSQPLCTALQIVLVELLRAAGVEFSGVIGHSSGEIGAAYAAGYISRRDAMYIAYYRGLHSSKAASPNGPHIKGSMLAVGTSKEDAEDILSDFIGQATIAASNSSSSVTLSGDEEAIDELDTIFGDENKFRRKLRVNKAYHSAHMLPCSQPYIKSLEPCGTRLQHPSISCTWYSTVYETLDMRSADAVSKLRDGSYWADNMVLPVMFLQGLQKALVADTFDIAVEVGPHPALNGPATQTIKETLNRELPYGSLLKRGKSPIEAFSDCLGFLWRHEGPSKYVQLDSFEDAATESNGNFHVVKGLPTYRWNHDKVYWHESRRSRNMRARKGPVHPLLGHEDPDSSAHQRRWRNVLQERELPWLSGHQLQGRTVFPATGYISILLEAARSLLDDGETARLIEISGFNIYRATTFDEDDSGVEILVGMDNIYRNETRQVIEAQFTFSSSVGKEASSLAKVASATVEILLGQPDAEILPAQQPDPTNLVDVTEDRFYGVMADLGYGYSGQFRTLSNLKRKLGVSVGRVAISRLEDKSQEPLLGHPGTLDCALQAILLAFSYPGDSMLWSLHVPTSINRIRVNPALCGSAWDHAESVPIRAATSGLDGAGLVGDAEVFGSSDSAHAAVQIEGLRAIPFVGATTADDNQMFARMKWSNMSVDPEKATEDSHDNSFQKGLAEALERTSLFYLRKFQRELPKDHPAWNDPVFSHYLKFSNHMTGLLDSGSHKYARREWANDTLEEILTAAAPYMETIDMKLILTTANAMPKVFNGEENILEHLLSSGLLDEQYVSGMGFRQSAAWLGSIVKQISHRYPQMNILEVGAGTGGATKQIFKNIGPDDFSSFTYTDISTGFFEEAATVFAPYKGRMIFKALDANADPASQGFTPASYDLIVGWFVIHATPNLENTLRNLRRLLRPGGLLVLGEFIGHDWTRDGFVFGTMPGWWAGVAEGRELSPCVSAEHWDEVLRASGFSGVDVITSQDACHDTHSASIFVSQAVDDTITYLREPLVSPLPVSSLGDGLPLHDLIIVGGSSLRTSRLVTQVKDSLSRFAVKLRSFKSLSDVPFDDDVSLDTTFVCLSELDKPVFETLNNTSFAAMKRLVSQEYTVLWVTEGRRTGKNPYVSMGISFVQTASHEVPGLNVQCIDFESKGGRNLDARALAEQVLRFHNLSARPQDQTSTEIMWSVDPEIVIDSECNYLIPRFEPQSSLNDRYNSFKRVVTRDVTVADAVVAVHRDKNGDYSLHEESIFAESTGSTSGDDVVELRVSYAAVTPINTFLGPRFVTLGVESSSGNRHVTLANKIASVVSVNKSSLVLWGATSTTVPEDQQLALLTANLYAGAILEHSLPGESLVVHNATAPAAAALARRAADIGVQVTFTASSSHEEPQVKRVIIPSYTTQREVRELLPSDITRFVSFTRAENDANIISCLPTYCRIETAIPTVCGEIPYSPPSSAASACLKDIISKALDCTRNDLEAEEVADSGYLVYPEDIIKETNANENHQSDRVPVISWLDTSALLPVRVSRLDTKFMFKSDKTYWLVGLSRDLGLSICDWMVSKGAKHIVITSRNPKVDAAWEEGWRRQGVQIKIMANNIRDAADVERVYKTIHKTLPPLAGVMQGAMVLKDRAVRDMSLEDMLTVLGPKVEGSLNLERVLGSTQLDFLVYLSSMARVLCNLGQVNYSAANAFMASLAIQRRRRGLAASVANISVVAGAGYVQRVGGDDGDNFIKLTGLRRVSEVDVHQQLAEAIVMGRSDLPLSPDEDAEIGGGLRTISLQDEEFLPYWTANPKFARFVRNKQETEDTRSGSNRTAGRSISERLEGANSEKQVYDMIKGSFLGKVRTILQIGKEIDDESLMRMRSTEIGMDSLIAVDLRSWFLKNISVSIPVLEILSNISIADLVEQAVQKVPAKLTPNLTADGYPLPPQTQEPESSGSSSLDTPSSAGPPTPASEPSSISTPVASSNETQCQGHPKLIERSLKLSPTQSMFWVVHSLLEDKTTLNHTGMYKLTGPLRVSELKEAVVKLSNLHESLRTIFYQDEDGQVLQGILKQGPLELEHKFIASTANLEQEFEDIKNHVHDLGAGQLLRMVLLTLSPTENFLIIGIHHVNFDGMCVQILLRDLEALYSRRPLPQSVLQYGDFAERQRILASGGSSDSDLAFWRREFASVPKPLPLSCARIATRKPLDHYAVHAADVHLDANLAAKVRTISQSHRSTAFHFYLATFRILLQRLILDVEHNTQDLCIGIADSNRHELETLTSLGPYVNLLPLRFNNNPATFAACLASARDKTFSALAHATVPFEAVLHALRVSRDTRFAPLFQVFIDYRLGARERTSFVDCVVETLRFEPGRTAYDLSVDILDYQDGGALIRFFGQTTLYSESDVKAFAACYKSFLTSFVEQPGMALTVGDWQYPSGYLSKTLELSRGPSFETRWPGTLLHQVDLAAQSQGQKPAIVVAGSENFQTYDEMQLMVRKIAYALVKHGVTPGQAVAVFQDAGLDWICSMLAIMKIGAIYLPLDSSTPSTRLSMIVADCQPASIIVNRSQSTFNIPVVIDVSGFGKEPHSISEDILTQVGASDDALILYTSGTTGTPKGVVLKHSTFCHEVEVSAEVYGLDSNIVVLQQSSFGFDMSVLQIFLGLALGGTVCIVPQEFRGDAAAISDFIVRHNVTYTCATPTEYASWLRYGDRQRLKSSSWNVALSGGEAASLSLIETFHELEKSDLRLFNGYGPTETTCCSTKIQLLPDEASNYQQIVSAGSPSWNESIYIIDDQMRLLPPGLPGEIAIGGAGVAAGYLKNKELTQEAFVPDIFATLDYKQKGWTTMYRTKDRGRLQLDGTLMLEGRISGDTQVKLRGVRIDLQDIENTILRASEGSIVTACATLRDEGDTKLTIAHVVLSNSFDLKTNEIKDQYLSRLSSSLPLPLAVRPSALVRIEKMPLMSSGKLDRRAVEALPLQQSMLSTNDKQGFHMDTDKRKLTDTESRLKKIWIQVLSHSDLMQPAKITADSDFFHVGGSSILLLEVRAQIQQTFGAVLRLIQLFESSTLGAMARFIENQTVDVAVEQIDWESESLPPPDLVWQLQSNTLATVNKPPSNRLKTIVLTGAAGGLGSQILNQLLASELVGIVICIGLRKIQSRIESGALPKPSKRLTYFDGDLRQPRLGLSESNWTSIASQADAVVHIGADVSHAKTYKTVRDTNVGATVEIARLCLASRAHLHFVSSGEVAMLGHIPARIFPEESVRNADVIPSQEDAQSEGYASSKWVCERLLENVAETGSGLRVWIHRPSSITAPRDEDEEAALVGKPDAPLLRSVFFYSRKLRAVPDADGQRLGGMLDLVGVVTVARDIAHAVLHDDGNGRERVSYVHHTGDAEMALDRLHEHLSEIEKQELGDAETHLPPFQVLPLAEWVESAQGVGMHPLLAMIFENAEREKKAMYFPKFVKRSRTVAAVPE